MLAVEGIKVLGCIEEYFRQTALGDGYAGVFLDALDRLMERPLYRRFD